MGWFKRYRDERRERRLHEDLDYECKFWWGDRAGSLEARCRICNPR